MLPKGPAPFLRFMKRILPVTAASAFVFFFITIVIIADRGQGDRWWGFIHEIPFGDKIGHLGLVGTLSLLCNLAVAPRRVSFLPRFVTITTFILLILLSLEEIAQAFLPQRTCDLFDWFADLAGLGLGQFIAGKIRLGSRAGERRGSRT